MTTFYGPELSSWLHVLQVQLGNVVERCAHERRENGLGEGYTVSAEDSPLVTTWPRLRRIRLQEDQGEIIIYKSL